MSAFEVMSASPQDEERVISTIVLAFATDPPARWMFTQSRDYLTHFPHFAHAFGGRALAHSSAYYVDDFAGVALWLPPGIQPDEEALGIVLERSISSAKLARVGEILELLQKHHPPEAHWYLPMTGVDPSAQGRGYGSALLKYALQRIDEDGAPAYLESTNTANLPLYERHGFKLLATVQVGDAPPMFPMIRPGK